MNEIRPCRFCDVPVSKRCDVPPMCDECADDYMTGVAKPVAYLLTTQKDFEADPSEKNRRRRDGAKIRASAFEMAVEDHMRRERRR